MIQLQRRRNLWTCLSAPSLLTHGALAGLEEPVYWSTGLWGCPLPSSLLEQELQAGWLLSTAPKAARAAAPWSPHAGLVTVASLLWAHLFTSIGKAGCPPSQKCGQISKRHPEHCLFETPSLWGWPSLPHCWLWGRQQDWGASAACQGVGWDGLVPLACPASPALGQHSSWERWPPWLPPWCWLFPLPNNPCLTQGGFSTGLGGGKDVKQAFP